MRIATAVSNNKPEVISYVITEKKSRISFTCSRLRLGGARPLTILTKGINQYVCCPNITSFYPPNGISMGSKKTCTWYPTLLLVYTYHTYVCYFSSCFLAGITCRRSHIDPIIKSAVTGQALVTLELRNTPGKKHKPKVVHAYITADAINASGRSIQKVKSGVSLRCARSILLHTSHYSRLEKPTIRLATQKRLPRIYYTWYLSLRVRTSDASQLE